MNEINTRRKIEQKRAEINYFKIFQYVFRYFDFYKAQNRDCAKNFKRKRRAINYFNLKR